MSESSSISISRVAWRLVQVGAYTVLACTVLFFALTRTEVGRDGIRRQVQSSFNERFAGTLAIGSLQGTLLNELIAKDVTLRDADGRLVASIDSVHTQPHWTDLLTSTLSVRSLTVVHPHLRLHRHADGTWNVQRALGRSTSSTGNRLDLTLSHIAVRDGRVTTSRDGQAPDPVRERWVFDYTQSELDRLTAEASVRWTPSDRLVDLESMSFRLPEENIKLESAQGEAVRERSRWSLNDFLLQLGETRLGVTGTLQRAPTDSGQSVMDVQFTESRLDNDELLRLIPRLPLRSTVTLEGRVGGSLDRLVVNDLQVSHDQSTVRVEGTAFGLPDSLDLEAQLLTSQIAPPDVETVWPAAPVERVSGLGPVRLGGEVFGTVEWRDRPRTTFNLGGTVRAEGHPGAVRGSLDVQRSRDAPVRYTGTLRADSLDLAPITGNPRLASNLTGRATIKGHGLRLASLQSEIGADLSAGYIAARGFSAADLQLTVAGRSAEGDVTVQQAHGGRLNVRGEVDATGATPLYNLVASAQNFDLEEVHPDLPTSRLNATLTTQGRGASWRSLTGTTQIRVDTSLVRHTHSTVFLPPHEVTLDVALPGDDAPRLELGGSILSATVEGTRLGPPLWTSGRLWLTSLRRALKRQHTPSTSAASDTASTPLIPSDIRTRARNAFTETGNGEPLHVRSRVAVHRMDLLHKWWEKAPSGADGFHAETSLIVGPDTLHTTGTVTANRLQLRSRHVDGLSASYALSGPLRPALLEALHADVSLQADTLHIGNRPLSTPSVTVSLRDGEGRVEANAAGLGRTGPYHLKSDVALLPGRTEFAIRDLYVGAGQHTWISKTTGSVSVHADAVSFDSIQVESQRPLTEGVQRVAVHGTLSSAPSDTLYTEMSDVLLHPVAQLANLSRPLGGRLNGHVALTGGWSQPQVEGAFQIHRLSFDRRILGTVQVQSRFAPNTPDVLVEAALAPTAPSLDSLEGPPLVPQGARTLEENRLQVSGRVRLPGWSSATGPSAPDGDQLDLNVNVDRADLFFFKYIFDENLATARGYTSGSIHVGGRFRHPLFDADLSIENARFTLPQFGLAYSASGPVEVDRDGIHLQDLNVTDKAGSATVRGSVLFNEYKYFSFDLAAQLDEVTIIDVADAQDLPFYGQIRASGPATLTGPLSNATLRSERARTTPDSELFIPVSEDGVDPGSGFIIFADSTGEVPDLKKLTRRDNILADRPAGEPSFLEGLEIDINVTAPEESTVNLVFDPVVGDVVTAVGSGRVQLQRQGGEFFVYGNFAVDDGTYLFTAGEVFVRRFNISGGTLTWDGPPTNAQLDIQAEYRTRASTAGLPGYEDGGRIPVRVLLDIGGRVATPRVDLSLARVRDERSNFLGSETLDAILNQQDRTTEYATSVLLTNTFLLTTESFTQGRTTTADGTSSGSLTTAGSQLAFNSVSQLVASQLNRYLGAALPNVDLNLALQGEDRNDLDVIYGVALRLLNERLVIRGEGVYTGEDPDQRQPQGPQGEFVVEVRLSSRVSVEAFYRRTGDELTQNRTLTSSTGAGVSYQTEFATWRELFARVFGWLVPDDEEPEQEADPEPAPVARGNDEASPPPESEEEDPNPKK